jgi:hypothetical protein
VLACILTSYRRRRFMQHAPTRSHEPCATLTIEEAREFEMLDALPPFDDCGNVAWNFEGEPTTRREKRWLELYTKLSAGAPISPRSLGCSPQNEPPRAHPKPLKKHHAPC